MLPFTSRLVLTSRAFLSQSVSSSAASGSPFGATNAGDPSSQPTPSCPRSSRHRRVSALSGRSATRQAVTSAGVAPFVSNASHSLAWRAQGVEMIVLRLARKRPGEPSSSRHGGVDLVAGVVVLQPDLDPADVGQPAHDIARVGCHQIREVGSALRRREPEHDLDVADGRHLTGRHEPERGDRLVELGIVDLAQRLQDARSGVHAESTSCASSLAAGSPASSGS